ncbi:MAG: glycoside hydrolase family 28 protein [Saprospiraceae bacterium]
MKMIKGDLIGKMFNHQSLWRLGIHGCAFMALILTACGTTEKVSDDPWNQVDLILQKINPPTFPDKDFDITAFGAVADDTTDCFLAIKSAIEKCHAEGGGRVMVPAGKFLVNGPIYLKSNTNLHISEGAVLRFSTNPKDYLPLVLTRWEGMECMNYSALVYAFEEENIAITGTGTLDGQASNDNWWKWKGSKAYGWEEGEPSQLDSLNRPYLSVQNTAEVPARERVFGEGHYLRPNFIQPYRCKNILIEGVLIRNSPMWVINPVLSENITIQKVKVISHGPNSDGCDPEACNFVLIRDSYFDTGDDCIALKSGRNQDGRNIGRAIENVVIQHCEMKDGHGGVVIGSEVSGGARNIFAEDCIMDSPNLERAIRVKTNQARGGILENLFFRNIMVGEVKEAVVRINMRYTLDGETDVHVPVIRNMVVKNVTSQKSELGIKIDGYDAEHPVKDVIIRNCQFEGVEKGNDIKWAEHLVFENLTINGKAVTSPLH